MQLLRFHLVEDGSCEKEIKQGLEKKLDRMVMRDLYDEAAIITAGDGVGVGKVYHYIEGKYALHQRAYRIHINTSEVMAVSRVAATSGTPQVPARR